NLCGHSVPVSSDIEKVGIVGEAVLVRASWARKMVHPDIMHCLLDFIPEMILYYLRGCDIRNSHSESRRVPDK
ncbi:unnamed protein product, partial [Mycena citricolor]